MELVQTLTKTAEEILKFEEHYKKANVLEKIAFAKQALKLNKQSVEDEVNDNEINKVASANDILKGIGVATAAGVGLGVASNLVQAGHNTIKDALFKAKKKSLIKEIKKKNPELKNMSDEQISDLLDAGHTIAPDLMSNPTIASSLVNIGNSLGGKLDPNTIKVFADAQQKGGHSDPGYGAIINNGLGIASNYGD